MKTKYLSVILLFASILAQSQPWFPNKGEVFNDDILPRVDITIHPDTLEWLYDNENSDHEFKAKFVYTTDSDSDTINDIGFRLRGNTSRNSDKKSFKISFNTFKQGRKYNGLEKMNLNGEHNDPSIIRSYLAWNMFEQNRVPSSRSNHVDVYINGDYFGLYINVEHIDEEFVERRFGNKLGNLYKCTRRVSLEYLGEDKEEYRSTGYDLKTNTDKDDYSDLINFIKVINNTSSAKMHEDIEPIFNMNGFIRYLVVEIFTGHWDAYSLNSNNYYLYNNAYTGKIEFIPYDVDNTFGIDWFGIDWATRDIYNWWNESDDKVLTSKTFGNQVYKDRFSFLLNELIEDYLNEDNLFPIIDEVYSKIEESAKNDPFRSLDYGWSFDDFRNSYTSTLETGHVTYGLKPYITERLESIKTQIELNPIAPIVENVYHNFPQITETIKIKADVTDDELNTTVKLYYNTTNSWQSFDMVSDDNQIFTAELAGLNQSSFVKYYIEATDASNNKTREPYKGEYSIHIGESDATLVINEFMASNQNSILDNYGELDDWIEIFNYGNNAVSLSGKYLTDDLSDPTKWNLPNIIIQPGEYYLIWADNDAEQGDNHTNFKLSSGGEALGIFDSFENSYAAIDTLQFGEQIPDFSIGRNSDGNLTLQNIITPGAENENAQYAYFNISYNMNRQVNQGNFAKGVDYIDIIASFNNYEGSHKIFDGDNDGIHSTTIMALTGGNNVEYKARMNGTKVELTNKDNRTYAISAGTNSISHWFNDEVAGFDSYLTVNKVNVYPNPVNSGTYINITSSTVINTLTMYNAAGKIVYSKQCNNLKTLKVNNHFPAGVYFVKVNTEADQYIEKLVVN